ncbi:oxygen-independent coproporphyrinogen III oxidase [Methylophaga muralis]|uniref:Coproporphyrinogen-III oxidase n=1 Tax=Methylophaga muralis TaxID=291169 RepID=A0A1E3GQD9_9GAMM|nr:oxygen-independent coproporphyrinogen III oxidase [Methylophaga muralis]ODN66258.1 Oxygen-independent coproporphyrinogen-III oxidase [Methylophaga muralis]
MQNQLIMNRQLIQKYDTAGPRYTSYPTALEFHESFKAKDFIEHAELSNQRGGPLSLYFHLPFCDTVCFYCACNKIITKNRDHAAPYLENLYKELALKAALVDTSRPVTQLHWGGGTPTFISEQQMQDLMNETRRHFHIADDADISIEIDPREANADTIALLKKIGFNRISLGIQDFDPAVQKAVNRIQSEAETLAVIDAARQHQFRSISVDLIYGLPLQTLSGFSTTLDKIIAANPDRISLFNYAHMPKLFKTQRQIKSEDLPTAEQKLSILQLSINKLTQAGYQYIGMDHFAKPDDELSLAQQQNRLHRNFQGYATHAECDLIGFGITSIGNIGDAYAQNVKTLLEYDNLLKQNQLPLMRGISLTEDDKLRRQIITRLICDFELNIGEIEQEYGIPFKEYFADAYPQLEQFAEDGLLQYNWKEIVVLPAGRLLIRNICMAFDKYSQQAKQRFSKVI